MQTAMRKVHAVSNSSLAISSRYIIYAAFEYTYL